MRRAGSWYLILIGLLFVVAGGAFTWLMWRSFDRASGQRDWAAVGCTVLESRIEKRQIGTDVPVEYRLAVLYGYEFEGESHTSDRYSLRGALWSSKEERALAMVEKFPTGTGQTCYVNPEDPAFAVLKRDSKAPGYSLWFPLVIVVGGLGIIAGAVRSMATVNVHVSGQSDGEVEAG